MPTPPPTSVAEEIKQQRPWANPAEEALVSILRSAAVARRAFAQGVEPFGISPAQYNVLRILRGAGAEGLPTLAVRDRLVEEAPGITRLIDKLETARFVRRDRSGSDRRTVRIHITPAGLALLEQCEPAVHSVQTKFIAGLPEVTEQVRLVELLAKARTGFR